MITLGQYLRPSKNHLPVKRFVTPEEFEEWSKVGKQMGFRYVASGPMIRSSYRAGGRRGEWPRGVEFFIKSLVEENEKKHRNGDDADQTSGEKHHCGASGSGAGAKVNLDAAFNSDLDAAFDSACDAGFKS